VLVGYCLIVSGVLGEEDKRYAEVAKEQRARRRGDGGKKEKRRQREGEGEEKCGSPHPGPLPSDPQWEREEEKMKITGGTPVPRRLVEPAIGHWPLPIAHCSLAIGHCSLLIAHCSLLKTRRWHPPKPTSGAPGFFEDTTAHQNASSGTRRGVISGRACWRGFGRGFWWP